MKIAVWAALICSVPALAEVRVWQGTLDLPTTLEGMPDPNPPFDVFGTERFNYPYTLRENITGERKNVAWRAIFLENEYLKCSVLPDIGGHLYTCTDKISGQPMFYANPSIKKARIGYRGAWAAFGIEFNFPVSHNWLSMSPVQFAYSKHDDGSASATVGAVDRVYGMQWNVELVLRPGSTVLEQHVTLNNRSDVRHRFYWWNNAGVEVWDDSKIYYPMRFSASHGFTRVETWPVDSSGIDMSVIKNQNKGPVSQFVHGSREPFMGVYHPHTNTGVVHYADYAELPGKKIWSWGVDPDGLDWRRALSDNNSAYVEVQAGLFRNQETYAFLEPRQTIHFSEYWMPVRGIGGIARANPAAGVLNITRQDDRVTVGFNANRRIDHARIRMIQGTNVLVQAVDLTPEQIWSRVLPPQPAEKLTFELRDSAGKLLLAHTEGVYDWTPADQIKVGPQKTWRVPPVEKRSEDDFVQVGKDQELNGALLAAYETYEQGLKRFPNSFALAVASGRLAAALMRYDDAVRRLEAAQARATYDPEVAYYLGIAYEGNGDLRKAQTAFETAQRMPSFKAAGSLRLAELMARQGDLAKAAKTLHGAPRDLRANEELIAVERALGREDEARKLTDETLKRYPTSAFLTGETNSDPERVLRIAAEYMRLGMWRPALEVLTKEYPKIPPEQAEPGALLPQEHPIVAYYRGYCRAKLGETGTADYARAAQLSTRFVFPAGPRTLDVLKDALRANPDDATAHFMIGSIYLSSGLVDRATAEWNEARRLNPKIPVLHANLGRTLLFVKGDPAAAADAFKQGIGVDPDNTELYTGIDQALSAMNRPAAERVAALERYPNAAQMPASLVYELALNQAEAGNFDKAEALFQNRFFPRQEGGTNVRQVWLEVRLARALASDCSAALPVAKTLNKEVPGLAFTRDGLDPFLRSARFEYLIGTVEQRCGLDKEANQRFERAAAQTRDLVWAKRAAQKLPGYDANAWTKRLQDAAGAENRRESSYTMYMAGLVAQELGDRPRAQEMYRAAFLEPDRMLAHHLARVAQAR